MTAIRERYEALCARGFKLDLTRGQPAMTISIYATLC